MPAPPRTLVLGDLHGAARALDQVLERARFQPGADRLVLLGDVCDRGPEPDRCLDRLVALPDVTLIRGNHDEWALEWMRKGVANAGWLRNGGHDTVEAYARRAALDGPVLNIAAEAASVVPPAHLRFLETGLDYLIETRPDGRRVLYSHAGWNPALGPEDQTDDDLRWSRAFWITVRLRAAAGETGSLTGFDAVFIGHTPTHNEWTDPRPALEVWNLDQGAGWDGVLTLMEADTHEFWQSDPVEELRARPAP